MKKYLQFIQCNFLSLNIINFLLTIIEKGGCKQ